MKYSMINKLLQDTLAEFRENFIGNQSTYHDPTTHANYPGTWTEKMFNIKKLESWLSKALTDIYKEGYRDGYNYYPKKLENDLK